MHLGFDTFVIEAGSSVSFDSAIPHAYLNEGAEPARGLWHVVGRNVSPSQDAQSAPGFPAGLPAMTVLNAVVDGADTRGVK